jgi:ABC-2 type transport system permease protein
MSLAWRRVWTILRREYLLRVRNKWFLITTFGFPLLVVGMAFLPHLLIGSGGDQTLRLGVVDRVGIEQVDFIQMMARQDSSIVVEPASVDSEASREEILAELQTSGTTALLVLEPGLLEGGSATLLARRSVGERQQRAIRDAVRQAVMQASLARSGLSPDAAATLYDRSRLGLSVSRVDRQGTQSEEVLGMLALTLSFMLYMMFIIYGQMITRGVLEEKTSDIAEVLISSVRPWELMLGKVLGIGGMGLTQIAIWTAAIGLLTAYGLTAAAGTLTEMGVDVELLSRPILEVGGSFLLFFLFGYFLFASVFGIVGAIVGDEQEVQQMTFVPIMLVAIPFVIAFTGFQNPTSSAMVWGSYFPFFTPILMLVRVTMGVAAAWEVFVSVVGMVLATVGMAWLTGRIYRVGILMTGKRPNLPELIRWIRYG